MVQEKKFKCTRDVCMKCFDTKAGLSQHKRHCGQLKKQKMDTDAVVNGKIENDNSDIAQENGKKENIPPNNCEKNLKGKNGNNVNDNKSEIR